MKLFICLLFFPICLSAAPDAIVDAPYEPDYAKGLPDRHLWHQVRESFLKHRYPQILKKHGLKLNCGTCTTVYMDIAFSVGLAGNISVHSIDRTKACGGEFSEKLTQDFLDFLREYPYPASLRGKSVRLRLGTGLKC